jgi:CHAT domain-containing protein
VPAAAREAREIFKLWRKAPLSREQEAKTVVLQGAQASEEAFKAYAPGSRVLHVSTHGFFLGRDCRSAVATRGVSTISSGKTAEASPDSGNPLLLSGLALAGSNHRDLAGPEEEDGILTAEEISALDLSGVQWAVLSACDTGVGEVKAGEGVFGLRRAFKTAGAGTLIMSLWSVDDESTLQWMRALYASRFVDDRPTAEAVRDACLEVLRSRREEGRSTHPFYWAAFVAVGDWE